MRCTKGIVCLWGYLLDAAIKLKNNLKITL